MYSGLFNPLTEKPFPAYYAFLAFNVLYRLGREVAVYTEQASEAGRQNGALSVLAARGERDGAERGAVLVSNPTEAALPLELVTDGRLAGCSLLSDEGMVGVSVLPAELAPGDVLLAEYEL